MHLCQLTLMDCCCSELMPALTRMRMWLVQFERTLIVAEDGAYVSYLEGCTAPSYDKNQVLLCHTLIAACDVFALELSTCSACFRVVVSSGCLAAFVST